ncbi:carbonic anhydrase, partial [Enterococcus faecium]
AQSFTNEAFAAQLERDLGVDVHDKDFLPFSDVEESVREDIAILRNSPLIPEDVVISGAVYDVDTGRMREIK